MKLLATAIMLYIAQLFLMPLGSAYAKAATGFLPEGKLDLLVYGILPLTILTAIASFSYARWAHVGLDVGRCITVACVYMAVPAMAFALSWTVAFYLDAALAVADLQETVVPLFTSFEVRDWQPFVAWIVSFIPFVVPFLLGPALASFFTRSSAVAEARIVM